MNPLAVNFAPADSARVHSFAKYRSDAVATQHVYSYDHRTPTQVADCEANAWVHGPSLVPWQPQPILGHHGNPTGVDAVHSNSFDLGLDRFFDPLIKTQENGNPYSRPAALEPDPRVATKPDGMPSIQSRHLSSSHQAVRRKTRSASNKKKWTPLPFNRYASRSSPPAAKSPRLLSQISSPKRAPWAKSDACRKEAARQILQLGRARKSRTQPFSSLDTCSFEPTDISENHGVRHDFGHPLEYSSPHAQTEELPGLDFLVPSFQNLTLEPSPAPTNISPDIYHLQHSPSALPDLNQVPFESCRALVENPFNVEWDPVAQTKFEFSHLGNEPPRIRVDDPRDKIFADLAFNGLSAASSHPPWTKESKKNAYTRNKKFEKGSLKGKGFQKSCRDSLPRQEDYATASEKPFHLSNQTARGTWSNSVRWMSDGAKERMALAKMMNNLHHIGADKSPFIPQTLVELAALRADMAEESKQRLTHLVGQRMAEMERKKSCAQNLSTQHNVLKVEKLFLGKQMHDELSPVFASFNCFNEQLPNSKILFASWPSLAELKDAGDNRGGQAARSLPRPKIDVLDSSISMDFHPAYIMPVSPPEEQQEWCAMPAHQIRVCHCG
ncbi:hypothetical protein CDD82_2083 [Ophiocordyceps australis]|uniref:Uncharacterized protein n=1 Tax=Ophiocordyceps australis TaxID=1399860 RepID=A0A2C5ZVD1_9HYPO|nr:hypothetical protein CDD82_2083 [Ophiocordyceps australis]